MPSESQLKYKYGILWVYDAFLLVFYIFLFDEINNTNNDEFTRLKNQLVENIDAILYDTFGFIDFNEFINSEEIKNIVVNHIEKVITKIESENNYFSLENLQEILLQIKSYHLKNLDYEPSKEMIINSYGNNFQNVNNNYIEEFREIKSLLERHYLI
ncbi:hypothetical protein GKZ90_0003435 [Flavobacterium sp. MC2016-06]|uniref:hypothetical protein n=1 Tax=Flavobacterium sp. MC2016-06 TaxID=2676308 RepID=UPI0012BA60C8|nr:hypothetical protein [Flavobacterium sp. MC2016-06]MBU3860580.1 hypothetical protein [Flavobacterium sp. MC2016-06]